MSYKQLGDFSNIKGGKRLPKGQMLVATPTNHPYIRVRDLGKSKTLELDSSFEYIEQETFEKIARYIVNENDIIISIVGTIGLIGKVGSTLDGANLTENCAKIVDVEGFDKDFLYYYLTSNEGQSAIHAYTVGAVQKKLPLKNIIELMIPDIPLENQKKIAKTLSVFDDRIAENKKINHHLAEMAESIWKEKYANLKPNSTLGNFFPIITGKKDANVARGGQYPFFSCSQGISYTDAYSFEGNAILLAGNGDFNVKTYNGKFEAYQRTYVLIPNNEYRLGFLYYAIKHFLSDITAGDRGSVIKYITKGDIENLNLYMPDDESDFELFNQFVSNTAQNNAEIERLTETRDTLLPKLMSGELSVID
nr:restriction endonuclease subunit S [Lactococcus lactis]